ncbi:uncharacterized protein LOC114146373 [Xiphophorus couchianus]|uniref:uncharacterized protein LOC114146372 n=1 Tax=Xiphophorus couchianus TaxID=32473 RepID=UPI001015FEF8|nr:uncharacterized protein LOC114146372 [Xiphophorus couchianus]XP_027876142.1 uncharacterized protein LOC114146373 [Xiphophorus couchianus]
MWLSENKCGCPSLFPPTLRKNKIAWLYLERADVTSGLSREFINCDILTNHQTAQQTDEDETLHPEVISTRNTMYHLRVPVFLLAALVLLRCIAAAPSLRYFSSGSSSSDDKQENALPDKESRSLPELIADPFSGLMGARPERGLTATNSHHVQKRKCDLGTCHRERLGHDLMVLAGRKEKKTDVGENSFGKREIHLPPAQLP